MEHYKKFYEIGNNRYYTIVADDETYIASESFLKIGKSGKFKKQKELNTGFKVLKFSPCIAQLFNFLNNLEPRKKQKYNSDDLVLYKHIDNKELKISIEAAYNEVINNEIKTAEELHANFIENNKIKEAESCEKYIHDLKLMNPMKSSGVDIDNPEYTSNNIIKTMLREGLEHLYSEKVNSFANNVYLYDQDEFGTLTIYRIIVVKNVVKTIDTFIYDKELISCLLKTLYEEGR